jgi:hypothetical protein
VGIIIFSSRRFLFGPKVENDAADGKDKPGLISFLESCSNNRHNFRKMIDLSDHLFENIGTENEFFF